MLGLHTLISHKESGDEPLKKGLLKRVMLDWSIMSLHINAERGR